MAHIPFVPHWNDWPWFAVHGLSVRQIRLVRQRQSISGDGLDLFSLFSQASKENPVAQGYVVAKGKRREQYKFFFYNSPYSSTDGNEEKTSPAEILPPFPYSHSVIHLDGTCTAAMHSSVKSVQRKCWQNVVLETRLDHDKPTMGFCWSKNVCIYMNKWVWKMCKQCLVISDSHLLLTIVQCERWKDTCLRISPLDKTNMLTEQMNINENTRRTCLATRDSTVLLCCVHVICGATSFVYYQSTF